MLCQARINVVSGAHINMSTVRGTVPTHTAAHLVLGLELQANVAAVCDLYDIGDLTACTWQRPAIIRMAAPKCNAAFGKIAEQRLTMILWYPPSSSDCGLAVDVRRVDHHSLRAFGSVSPLMR